MEYVFFTYPDCGKCEELKRFLKGTTLEGSEYDLAQKEGRLKVREFLSLVRRDEKGSIVLPVFVLREEGRVLGLFNTAQELDTWLKSKA
ncbi:MAG: hypothetical protein A2Y69_02210 [Candidatus Aminicenantes bacterium RBG_13_59_9]|nr:MAG: hypothetical protein A2Y69_02210 [Candidatus Aminicenantes bacterium RBG_13_59_9]